MNFTNHMKKYVRHYERGQELPRMSVLALIRKIFFIPGWFTFSYLQNNDNTLPSGWTAEFSTESFDEFMIMESLKNTNINATPTHAG